MSATAFLTIGLTGPSGAGKGLVDEAFAACGIPAVDTDRVYHDLLLPPSPCLDELCAAFSSVILAPDGTLNRRALAGLVFADTDEARARLETLNRITHRYVTDETRRILDKWRNEGKPAGVIDAPLLLEAGMRPLCAHVVAVLASAKTRRERLLRRDGLTPAEIDRRLAVQHTDEWYRAAADTVLVNDGQPEAIFAAVRELCQRLGVLS